MYRWKRFDCLLATVCIAGAPLWTCAQSAGNETAAAAAGANATAIIANATTTIMKGSATVMDLVKSFQCIAASQFRTVQFRVLSPGGGGGSASDTGRCLGVNASDGRLSFLSNISIASSTETALCRSQRTEFTLDLVSEELRIDGRAVGFDGQDVAGVVTATPDNSNSSNVVQAARFRLLGANCQLMLSPNNTNGASADDKPVLMLFEGRLMRFPATQPANDAHQLLYITPDSMSMRKSGAAGSSHGVGGLRWATVRAVALMIVATLL